MDRERRFGLGQMIGPEVSVCSFKGASCHPQKPAGYQHVGSGLHEPRRRRVPQHVGCHVIAKAGSLRNLPHCPADTERGVIAPLDDVALALSAPTSQVR
jgi:hypothetical protein